MGSAVAASARETVKGIDRLYPLHDGRFEEPYDVHVEVMELPVVWQLSRPQATGLRPQVSWAGAGSEAWVLNRT